MEIKSAKFVKGILGTDDILTDGKPHIAFLGRSNAGKSSVINSLVSRKNLAKSSSVPGKTREINFFLVNDTCYFADLPGYGFAKISRKKREKLKKLINWYLTYSGAPIRLVILVMDAFTGPTELDREIYDALRDIGHKVLIVANKADRVIRSRRRAAEKSLKDAFADADFVLYSAKTKEGRARVLRIMME